jgi:hypothetical protein
MPSAPEFLAHVFRLLLSIIERKKKRMPKAPVFISHASRDDAFVRDLRQALEGFNIPVWVDSRNLRGGNALAPAIAEAIAQARHVLVVLSPKTIDSSWVRREIRQALAVQ